MSSEPANPDPLVEVGEAARADSTRRIGTSRPSGRRWKWVAIALLAFGAAVVGGLAWRSGDQPRYRDGIRYDPIEDDPSAQPALRAAEREAKEVLKDAPRGMGFCHWHWGTKKAILKEKYRIEWRTPAELNPQVAFD